MVDLYYAKLNTEEYLINSQKEHEQLETETNNINYKIMENAYKGKDKLINRKLSSDTLLNKYENKLISATSLLQSRPRIQLLRLRPEHFLQHFQRGFLLLMFL